MQKRVESYTFGVMVVGGELYRADLAIMPDGTVDPTWWRKETHRLGLADIETLVAAKPDVLVAGTGARGMMEIEAGLKEALAERGIELMAEPTSDAVKLYNKLRRARRVAACFHLTC
jgi:hypothetical protein